MGNTDKYKVYQLYKSYNGTDWFQGNKYKAYLLEENSSDCGYSARTITTTDDDCSGTTKITTTTILYQESEDFGETWTTVSSSSTKTYDYYSEDCGYIPSEYSEQYLTLVAKSNGYLNFIDIPSSNKISYSTDNGNTWSEPAKEITVKVNSGDKVLFKGNMTPSIYGIGSFSASTATYDIQGNVMSLLYGDNFINQTNLSDKSAAFRYLFRPKSGLLGTISAKNLILPATTLSTNCYNEMFAGCTLLTQAPSLPATTLASSCYKSMFLGCTSLTTAPSLPATTMVDNCYQYMFRGCTSLVNAPSLPATTLAQYCYNFMFQGCTSLTTAPVLPTTALVRNYDGCYVSMFAQCSNLNYIKMLATTIYSDSYLSNWVQDVASSGTFVKAATMTSLPSGNNGIPNGWTVEDA